MTKFWRTTTVVSLCVFMPCVSAAQLPMFTVSSGLDFGGGETDEASGVHQDVFQFNMSADALIGHSKRYALPISEISHFSQLSLISISYDYRGDDFSFSDGGEVATGAFLTSDTSEFKLAGRYHISDSLFFVKGLYQYNGLKLNVPDSNIPIELPFETLSQNRYRISAGVLPDQNEMGLHSSAELIFEIATDPSLVINGNSEIAESQGSIAAGMAFRLFSEINQNFGVMGIYDYLVEFPDDVDTNSVTTYNLSGILHYKHNAHYIASIGAGLSVAAAVASTVGQPIEVSPTLFDFHAEFHFSQNFSVKGELKEANDGIWVYGAEITGRF